jgi:hypothetical protein
MPWLNSYRASLRREVAAQKGTGLPPAMWHGGGRSQKLDYGKHEAGPWLSPSSMNRVRLKGGDFRMKEDTPEEDSKKRDFK